MWEFDLFSIKNSPHRQHAASPLRRPAIYLFIYLFVQKIIGKPIHALYGRSLWFMMLKHMVHIVTIVA